MLVSWCETLGDLTNKVVAKTTESQDLKQQHDVIDVLDI